MNKLFAKQYIIGFVIILFFFTLAGTLIKTPLTVSELQRTSIFQRTDFFMIAIYYLLLSFFYFSIVYILFFTSFGTHLIEQVKQVFQKEKIEQDRTSEIEAQQHKNTMYALEYEPKNMDLVYKARQELITKLVEENGMQRIINKKLKELPKEDAMFVINAFIGKDKPFETKQDYDKHVQRQHEKEMLKYKLKDAKSQSKSNQAEAAWNLHNTKKKIKDDEGDPDEYLQDEDGESDKV